TSKKLEIQTRVKKTLVLGSIFSVAFCLVLTPWTIRNWRLFHVFQPLAPQHAEMPGEFVPRGYLAWLRTWIEDQRYIGPVLWQLDSAPIHIDDFPDTAFDSEQERNRVVTLLEQYNHPAGESPTTAVVSPRPVPTPPPPSKPNAPHQANSAN